MPATAASSTNFAVWCRRCTEASSSIDPVWCRRLSAVAGTVDSGIQPAPYTAARCQHLQLLSVSLWLWTAERRRGFGRAEPLTPAPCRAPRSAAAFDAFVAASFDSRAIHTGSNARRPAPGARRPAGSLHSKNIYVKSVLNLTSLRFCWFEDLDWSSRPD